MLGLHIANSAITYKMLKAKKRYELWKQKLKFSQKENQVLNLGFLSSLETFISLKKKQGGKLFNFISSL